MEAAATEEGSLAAASARAFRDRSSALTAPSRFDLVALVSPGWPQGLSQSFPPVVFRTAATASERRMSGQGNPEKSRGAGETGVFSGFDRVMTEGELPPYFFPFLSLSRQTVFTSLHIAAHASSLTMFLVSRAASARFSGTLLRGAICSPSSGGCRTGTSSSKLGGGEAPLLATRELNVAAAAASSSSTPSSSARRAFIPCSVKIIHVSRPCAYHDPLVTEWLDKARRYAKIEELRLPVNPVKAKDNADAATRAEGERVLKQLTASDFVVLLDERGRAPSSERLAEIVAEAGERCGGGGSSSSSSLAFVVGGPFGHAKGVQERADARISLSSLVLNHAVARVVLAEALYRAYTILKGVPYHH